MKPYKPEDALDALERINTAIAGARSIEELLPRVLDEMLDIFECDRAWLLYPCIPEADAYQVPMERTRPEWPGASELDLPIPMDPFARDVFQLALDRDAPLSYGLSDVREGPPVWARFHIRSQLLMAIRPRSDQPWMLGIHNCAVERRYDAVLPLFNAIGRRIGDGLTTLIAMRELRRSQERFQTLVEHAPEAIVVFDAQSLRIVEENAKASALYGMPRDVLLDGVGMLEVSASVQPGGEPSKAALDAKIQRALEGAPTTFEWTCIHTDGREVPCEVRFVVLPDPEQHLIRASITDITARKQAELKRKQLEAQLFQSQKMEAIGQLTGGVAHDFNNLLTVVLGNLDLMKSYGLGEENERAHERATAATEKAAGLIRQLLAFSRQQPLQPVAVDVGVLLASVEQLLSRTLGEDVELVITVNAETRCEADATQLESALLNLALNARDAMPDGGLLRINADEVDHGGTRFLRFQIIDDGKGIDPSILDLIFTPFFTTKEVGQGTGLGLAMVYGFAQQSGGQLLVHSEVGQGSTFELYLPCAEVSNPASEPETPVVSRGQGQAVLLVEDDGDVRHVVCTYLLALGYRVVEAESGPDALQQLRARPDIELLLTDVILPGGMTGLQLAASVLALRPELPVLYMSGYSENALLTRGRLSEGIRLLEKPFSQAELGDHVAAGLRRRGGTK